MLLWALHLVIVIRGLCACTCTCRGPQMHSLCRRVAKVSIGLGAWADMSISSCRICCAAVWVIYRASHSIIDFPPNPIALPCTQPSHSCTHTHTHTHTHTQLLLVWRLPTPAERGGKSHHQLEGWDGRLDSPRCLSFSQGKLVSIYNNYDCVKFTYVDEPIQYLFT